MMDYQKQPCKSCGEHTVIYHQSIADECCESCGEWQSDDDNALMVASQDAMEEMLEEREVAA